MAIANGVIGRLDRNGFMKGFYNLGLYCDERLFETGFVLNAMVRIM